MPNYTILHVNQIILNAGSRKQKKNLVKNRSPQGHFEGQDTLPLIRVKNIDQHAIRGNVKR